MNNQLLDWERRVVAAACAFANLESVDSEQRVERVFRGLVDFSERPVFIHPDGTRRRFGSLVSYYEQAQAVTRDWLDRISRRPSESRSAWESRMREVAAEVAPVVSDTVTASVELVGGRLKQTFDVENVLAACAYAVALILIDRPRPLYRRLGRCAKPGCGSFNLDTSPAGRPSTDCPGHWEAAKRERNRVNQAKFRRDNS
jgi:hypothetical protein